MSVDLEAMRSKLQLDAKDFASGLDAASGKLSGFRRLMASASATAAGFLGASVIQRGIEGIKNQIGGFISASSDLNETVSKTQVVFGDSFDAIDKWAKNSAAAFGLSRQQAFDTVSTYGAMAKAAGLSGDAAVSFGTDLVGAAADLGSFWNFDPSQVAEDIRSGLAGEAEPLRKYNIFLNETAVNAKAAELGLGGANGELTDQEKVLARQAIIMEQLGPAAGDYARTQKGLANGTRTLTAYFKNFQAWLGGKIVPTVAKGVAWVNKLAGRFQRLREDGLSPTQALLKTLRIELYQVFGRDVLDAITSVARAFVAVWGAVKLWGGSLLDAFKSGSKVSDLVERFPKPLQGMAKGFLTIADAVGDAFAAFRSGGFSGLLDQLGPSLKQALSGIGDLAGALVDAVTSIPWDTVGSAVLDGLKWAFDFVRKHPDYVVGAVLGGAVGVALVAAIKNIPWGEVANVALTGLRSAFAAVPWSDMWSGTSSFFTGLWKSFQNYDYNKLGFVVGAGLRAAIVAVGPTVLSVAGDLLNWFKTGLENHWPTILKWFALWPVLIPAAIIGAQAVLLPKAWEFLKGFLAGLGLNWESQVKPWLASLPMMAVNAIGDLSASLAIKGAELLYGFWTGAAATWNESIAPWIASRAAVAVAWIGDVSGSLLQRGKDLLQGLWTGASDTWTQMATWLASRAAFAVFWIGDLAQTLWSKGVSLIEGLWDGASEQWDSLTDWFASRGAEAASWVGDLSRYLYQAGIDLIQGLINGIMDKIPGLQWAVSQVNSLINLIDRGKSPWPMMIDAGSDAIDGLVIGLDRRMGSLASAVNRVNGVLTTDAMLSGRTNVVDTRGIADSGGGSSRAGASQYFDLRGSIIGGDVMREIDARVAAGVATKSNRIISSRGLGESYS